MTHAPLRASALALIAAMMATPALSQDMPIEEPVASDAGAPGVAAPDTSPAGDLSSNLGAVEELLGEAVDAPEGAPVPEQSPAPAPAEGPADMPAVPAVADEGAPVDSPTDTPAPAEEPAIATDPVVVEGPVETGTAVIVAPDAAPGGIAPDLPAVEDGGQDQAPDPALPVGEEVGEDVLPVPEAAPVDTAPEAGDVPVAEAETPTVEAPTVPAEATHGLYEEIGTGGDWTAIRFEPSEGRMVCAIFSRPTESLITENGNAIDALRGERAAFITWESGAASDTGGVFSAIIGAPIDEAFEGHEFSTESATFPMFGHDDRLYAPADSDAPAIAAIRAGMTLTVKATLPGGRIAQDTYSLKGVQASTNLAKEACPAAQ